jgi:hypothetical protein
MAILNQCLMPLTQIESTDLMVRAIKKEKDLRDFIVLPSQQAGMVWLLDQL